MMIDFLQQSGIGYVLVLTKADKLTKTKRAERLAGFAREIPEFDRTVRVEFSAQTGEGAVRLREIIQEISESSSQTFDTV